MCCQHESVSPSLAHSSGARSVKEQALVTARRAQSRGQAQLHARKTRKVTKTTEPIQLGRRRSCTDFPNDESSFAGPRRKDGRSQRPKIALESFAFAKGLQLFSAHACTLFGFALLLLDERFQSGLRVVVVVAQRAACGRLVKALRHDRREGQVVDGPAGHTVRI